MGDVVPFFSLSASLPVVRSDQVAALDEARAEVALLLLEATADELEAVRQYLYSRSADRASRP